ncbi:MAG: hypothetical protein J6P21_01600 [Clostridia bacterium]|nr:hypothetical protein [Clostridia bacterium]
MVGNRKSFSKITAIFLSIFGLMGFNNNIDSRVYAMKQNGQNEKEEINEQNEEEIEVVEEQEENSYESSQSILTNSEMQQKSNNVENNNINIFKEDENVKENGNNDFDIDDIISNPTAKSIIMNKKGDKNEKDGKDNTKDNTDDKKDDKKDGENEKWSTGKKVGVISAIVVFGAIIIGGIIYLVNRFLRKKNDTPARGLPPQNLNQNSKSNTNLNINNNLSNINNKPVVPNR